MTRIPRSTLFYLVLVAGLGLVFWFFYQSIQNGSKGTEWSYSTLLSRAGAHQVQSLVINGTDGTATDKSGARHDVNLGDTTDSVATNGSDTTVAPR